MRRELGRRGRTPKYRLGRYGPHSREAFEAAEIAFSSDGGTSAETARSRNRDNARVQRSRIAGDEDGGEVRWDYEDMEWVARIGSKGLARCFVAQLFLPNSDSTREYLQKCKS